MEVVKVIDGANELPFLKYFKCKHCGANSCIGHDEEGKINQVEWEKGAENEEENFN